MKKRMFLIPALFIFCLISMNSQAMDAEEVSKNYAITFEILNDLEKSLTIQLPRALIVQIEKSFRYFTQSDHENALECVLTATAFLDRLEKRYTKLYLKPNDVSPFGGLRKSVTLVSNGLASLIEY